MTTLESLRSLFGLLCGAVSGLGEPGPAVASRGWRETGLRRLCPSERADPASSPRPPPPPPPPPPYLALQVTGKRSSGRLGLRGVRAPCLLRLLFCTGPRRTAVGNPGNHHRAPVQACGTQPQLPGHWGLPWRAGGPGVGARSAARCCAADRYARGALPGRGWRACVKTLCCAGGWGLGNCFPRQCP